MPALLGHASPGGGVLGSLSALPELVQSIEPGETMLAVIALAILFLMPRRWRRIVPPQLLALVVGTLVAVWVLGAGSYREIGAIPAGLPELQMPYFTADQWQSMIVDALVLAMLGAIDALLTSVIADSLTRTQHDSDKELVGQGLGNLASGLFGGLPGAGATMGTVVNIQTGARTAISGLTRALILGVVVLWAAGLVSVIPLAVLAGIAIKVGIDIIDWGFLRRAHRVSIRGAAIMYGVIAMTVFVDLITAVGIGLFVANILTIRRLADLQSEGVRLFGVGAEGAGGAFDCANAQEEERKILSNKGTGVSLLCLSGPLIFGAAKAVTRQQNALRDARSLVVDLTGVPHIGVTTSLAVEATIREAAEHGCRVYLAGLQEQPRRRFERLGLGEVVPAQNWIDKRVDALKRAVADRAGQGASAA
jgi:SulP family sulfate permease